MFKLFAQSLLLEQSDDRANEEAPEPRNLCAGIRFIGLIPWR